MNVFLLIYVYVYIASFTNYNQSESFHFMTFSQIENMFS